MTVVDSSLARRNPTVKLALLFLVSLVLLFVFDPVTPAVLYVVSLGAVVAAARIRPRVLLAAHLPFVGVALGLVLVNALSRPGTVLFAAGPLRVTEEGLSTGGALALRTLVIGLLSLAFVASTDGVRLMSSLHSHARLGVRITYAVLAGYRTLGELPVEWQLIRQAQSVRMPLTRRGRPRAGLTVFARSAFALLVVSLRRAERMAVALESRGVGLEPRSTWRPVALTRTDWVFAAGVVAVLGAVLTASALAGVLRGAEAM
ncbi:MAG: cobalt transport protein [Microbacteriaceae bacterium]|nr:cobalt transport protein [Microbacteriaceae bacterium]